MRWHRRFRPGAAKPQRWTLPALAGVVGIGVLLVTGLLAPATAPAAGPAVPDRYIYVTNPLDNTLSVIDGSTYTVVATVPVGTSPAGVAVSPDGRYVYIAETEANAVSVMDTGTNTITTTVALPARSAPAAVALSP